MNLLVDTCVLIWALQAPERLRPSSRVLLEDEANTVSVSVVSFWEISLKHALGKLTVRRSTPDVLPDFVKAMGWDILPLDAATASTLHRLPRHDQHRDPFDRMLVWTAITQKLPLVSADASLRDYASAGLQLAG